MTPTQLIVSSENGRPEWWCPGHTLAVWLRKPHVIYGNECRFFGSSLIAFNFALALEYRIGYGYDPRKILHGIGGCTIAVEL